jgi:hypothetical protein
VRVCVRLCAERFKVDQLNRMANLCNKEVGQRKKVRAAAR